VPPSTPERRSLATAAAQGRGALWAISSLVLLWPLSAGVVKLRDHHVTRGVLLIAVAVGFRLVLSRLVTHVNSARAQRRRVALRTASVEFLASSTDDGIVELLAAIDDAAHLDEFETLRAAAGTSVLALPALFFVAGWLPLVIVVGLVGLSVPFYIRAGRRAEAAEATFREHRAQLGDYQLDLLKHGVELRALGAVSFGARTISALSTREHEGALRAIREALGSSLVTEFLGGVSVGFVAMVEGFGLLHGTKSLGPALLSVLLTAEFIGWVRRYGVAFHQRQRTTEAVAFLQRVRRGVAHPVAPDVVLSCDNLVAAARTTPVSLRLHPGEHLAVTGPSGSGKTTLLETWLGWRSAVSGDTALTSHGVGVVTVATSLGDGRLRDILTLNTTPDHDDVVNVLREVGLEVDLDRSVSPDGVGLSSGERVRLLIARALLHHAALLVLDDITGLLDEPNRQLVREALARRPGLAVIEATVDEPALTAPSQRVVLS